MLDVAWPELLVIGAVALVAIGPKDLPKVMREMGRWAGKARRFSHEVRSHFEQLGYETDAADKLNKNNRRTAMEELQDKLVAAIRTVHDPEIPVNLYDLGLIYRLAAEPAAVAGKYDVVVDMTLTTPNCPIAGEMPDMVKRAILTMPEVNDAAVNLVWDPPWDKSRMSDEARLELGMF